MGDARQVPNESFLQTVSNAARMPDNQLIIFSRENYNVRETIRGIAKDMRGKEENKKEIMDRI